jgi:hypothetical protein
LKYREFSITSKLLPLGDAFLVSLKALSEPIFLKELERAKKLFFHLRFLAFFYRKFGARKHSEKSRKRWIKNIGEYMGIVVLFL